MKSTTDMANPITTPSYEDFEPYCEWKREEGKETLEVHVQGFKREQLKVHVSNRYDLTITGEARIDDMKWRRFTKEFKIPKDCNKNEINARFTKSGHLYIVMPKNLTSTNKDQESAKESSKHSKGPDKIIMKREIALKVVIVTVVLAMGVYAICKYNRPSTVNILSNSSYM